MIAWVLNVEADVQFARPGTPSAAARAAADRSRAVLARTLLAPGDRLAGEHDVKGLPGRAYCATRAAMERLAEGGAIVPPHPPEDVVRRVNHRAFSAALGAPLGGAFVRTLAEAVAMLESAPPVGTAWRVKPAFGMSARGHRVIAPGRATETDRRLLLAEMREGVEIVPNVRIVRELALHGELGPGLRLGRVVEQRVNERGQWLSSSALDDEPRRAELAAEAERVAAALEAAGYFGPFGIDAFEWEGGFVARSEINARYSMGYAVGFATSSSSRASALSSDSAAGPNENRT